MKTTIAQDVIPLESPFWGTSATSHFWKACEARQTALGGALGKPDVPDRVAFPKDALQTVGPFGTRGFSAESARGCGPCPKVSALIGWGGNVGLGEEERWEENMAWGKRLNQVAFFAATMAVIAY
jgi:hypothetical protein